MINTLKTLCALSGVSSFEDEVRDYIRQRVTPYATDLRVDAMGNLIVLKKGARATGNKLMLCAHMDEVGLIIKSITEDGYLKFGCVGGIDRRVLLGKQVALGEQKVTGVIGLKAIHMTTAEERKKVPKLEEVLYRHRREEPGRGGKAGRDWRLRRVCQRCGGIRRWDAEGQGH